MGAKRDWSKELTGSVWAEKFPNGPAPQFVVTAPGRVNIIGEHVDHQAYGVLPCAIVQSLGVACAVLERKNDSDPLLTLRHVKEAYEDATFNELSDLRVKEDKTWTNYVCAAYMGICEFFLNGQDAKTVGRMFNPKQGITWDVVKRHAVESGIIHREDLCNSVADLPQNCPLRYHFCLLFDGNIPPAAGLSSSAAVVVGSSLALCSGMKALPKKDVVADICSRAEQYSGVASGGMDQAAILLSEEGRATHINFKPIQVNPIKLPVGGALMIVNTCREAPKAKIPEKLYNKRVFELKAACLALMPKEAADAITPQQLLDLQLRDVIRNELKTTEREALSRLPEMLDSKVYTRDDMESIFGTARMNYLLEKRCGHTVLTNNDAFYVYDRARHVLSEHLRVNDFIMVCESSCLTNTEKLERLGQLMNASGTSLDVDYDCSCDEIRHVCSILHEAGAYGARLTGAGWGGCVVALVPDDPQVQEHIINKVKEGYFAPHYKNEAVGLPLECLPSSLEALGSALFVTHPSPGASVSAIAE